MAQLYPQALSFPFSCLLQHAGVQWGYFSPPPHGGMYHFSLVNIHQNEKDIKEKSTKFTFNGELIFVCLIFETNQSILIEFGVQCLKLKSVYVNLPLVYIFIT
jgi:hypothetical protein